MADPGNKRTLIVVVGPTAVGKTQVAISIAKKYKLEVLSADSRQFFRELSIGTAKPDLSEMEGVVHHFVGHLSVFEPYDAGQFARDAERVLGQIFATSKAAILVGGSGLYLDALVHGFDRLPPSNPTIRTQLNEIASDKGLEPLLNELSEKDPVYYDQVDRMNPVRIIRALEVIRITDRPFSSFLNHRARSPAKWNCLKIGLDLPREELYRRIDDRMDKMIDSGLFEEARKWHPHADLNALQTVGYTEIFGHLEGKYDKEEAIRLLKRNSRRYAKRQLTWFRKDEDINWFDPQEIDRIVDFLNNKLNR